MRQCSEFDSSTVPTCRRLHLQVSPCSIHWAKYGPAGPSRLWFHQVLPRSRARKGRLPLAPQPASWCVSPVFLKIFFFNVYLFLGQRETEHERGRGRERETQNRKQALSRQPRAWRGAQTHGPRDRDLAEVGRLTDYATQAPQSCVSLPDLTCHCSPKESLSPSKPFSWIPPVSAMLTPPSVLILTLPPRPALSSPPNFPIYFCSFLEAMLESSRLYS